MDNHNLIVKQLEQAQGMLDAALELLTKEATTQQEMSARRETNVALRAIQFSLEQLEGRFSSL